MLDVILILVRKICCPFGSESDSGSVPSFGSGFIFGFGSGPGSGPGSSPRCGPGGLDPDSGSVPSFGPRPGPAPVARSGSGSDFGANHWCVFQLSIRCVRR